MKARGLSCSAATDEPTAELLDCSEIMVEHRLCHSFVDGQRNTTFNAGFVVQLPSIHQCLVQNNTTASVLNSRHTSRQFAQNSSSKNPLFSRRVPSRDPCHDFIRPPQLRASDADGLRTASRSMPRPPRPQRTATQVSCGGRVDQERRSGRGQGTPGAGCVHRSSLQKSAESCSRWLESYAK